MALNTPILTVDGWKEMASLQIGDCVFGGDGQPYPVIACSEIMAGHPTYRIIFDDGNEIVADADHRWLTFNNAERAQLTKRTDEYRAHRRAIRAPRGTGKKPWLAERNRVVTPPTLERPTGSIRTTLEMAGDVTVKNGRRNYSIPICEPLYFSHQDLPIDPYVFGVWLGDGVSASSGLTCAEYALLQNISDRGYEIRKWGAKYAYSIVGIKGQLRALGVIGNKHIPDCYKRASIEQRLELLRGLMDTDGCCDLDGSCEFTSTREVLARDVWDLAISLGIKIVLRMGRASINGKDCGTKYRLTFSDKRQVFNLRRKAERQVVKERGTQKQRYIIAIESVESVPVRCIAIDSPDHLYLAGRALIPTHNTDCLLMESLRQIDNPAYRAILFRRSFPMLEAADGLIDRSQRWFPGVGGHYNDQKHVWKFQSGARIYFGHMQHEDDRLQYQGAQFAFIGFDELSEFTEMQYTYMFSRNRAPESARLRVYIRSASNPGNIGHQWVKDRFVTRDIINRIRHFAVVDGRDIEVTADHPDARSRAFYPGRLIDNPAIGQQYIRNLNSMTDAVMKARLLDGDWDIEYTEGRIYDTWTSANISADIAAYNPDLPVYWGVDDGYAYGHGPGYADYHPRVVLFIQDNALGGLNVIDEYAATGETYGTTFENVLDQRRYPYRPPSLTWIDGSAATFRAEFDSRGLTTANGTHRVVEGIKAVRQLVLGADGARRLLVSPKCSNLIYEMPLYRSDPKARSETGELVPMKLNDHSEDAFRYVAYHKRGGQ